LDAEQPTFSSPARVKNNTRSHFHAGDFLYSVADVGPGHDQQLYLWRRDPPAAGICVDCTGDSVVAGKKRGVESVVAERRLLEASNKG